MHKSKPRANPILVNGIIIVYVLKAATIGTLKSTSSLII